MVVTEKRNNPTGPKKGKQARKSEATRRTIIDTTIRCLVKYGYHDTTYIKVSEVSGLSRGAMRYHFPARNDLIRAAIHHLHEKRIAAFRKAAGVIPAGPGRSRKQFSTLWLHVNHPTYMVFIELAVAARRDRELDSILRPAQENFKKECYYAALEMFPEWLEHRDELSTAIDLCLYTMEGMVLDNLSVDAEYANQILDYLEQELGILLKTDVQTSSKRIKAAS